jgi:hypothetical protein
MTGITQEIFLKRGVQLPFKRGAIDAASKPGDEVPDCKFIQGTMIEPGYYRAEIREGFAYLLGFAGIGVTLEWVEFPFQCPIDSRVKIRVSSDFPDIEPHCTTLNKRNHECPFIQAGCIGCRFDKEKLLAEKEQ